MRLRRLLFGFIAALIPSLTPAAATHDAGPASLAGQLLVATPDMDDPRFVHTVILLVRHDRNGALGLVINRPVEEKPYAAVLEALGEKDGSADGTVRLFAGGPVEPRLGFVLHSADYRRAETMPINDRFAMTSSLEILRDLAHHRGPAKALITFGYAGWGPGQLDAEIAQRAWFTTPAESSLVFDADRDKLWESAAARRSVPL